jgi:hypothetical protein
VPVAVAARRSSDDGGDGDDDGDAELTSGDDAPAADLAGLDAQLGVGIGGGGALVLNCVRGGARPSRVLHRRLKSIAKGSVAAAAAAQRAAPPTGLTDLLCVGRTAPSDL